jgi:hypothetical protein
LKEAACVCGGCGNAGRYGISTMLQLSQEVERGASCGNHGGMGEEKEA